MEHIVPDAETRLWIPGTAAVDTAVRKVARAVKQYDEALNLARHELTGDWVVTIGEMGHPVFGFGKELPDPDQVERILASRDMKRHGRKIMAQLARRVDRERQDARLRVSDENEELAEHFEHAFRKEGRHNVSRIFVPRSIPKRGI